MAMTRAVRNLRGPAPRSFLVAGLVAAGLVACGGGSGTTSAPTTNQPAATTLAAGNTAGGDGSPVPGMETYPTPLTGAAVVPGPGDPDAVGTAVVVLDPVRSEVCFKITVAYVDRPDGAHIHSGPPGETGPAVLTLAPLEVVNSNRCVPTGLDLIERIGSDPRAFYVDLHNPAYPDGAMRGQLAT